MIWRFEKVDGPYGNVTEGPAWDGQALLFTSIQQSRIMKYDPGSGLSTVYKENTNYANGTMFDKSGILHACEGGARRVVRYEDDGSTTVLADQYEGQKFNIPNDLAIDLRGRIWFTDPYYEGAAGQWSEDRSNKELDHDSVYRLDNNPDGSYTCSRVTFDTTRPNGLLFSLDHDILYVAQSGRELYEPKQFRSYQVNSDGSLTNMKVLHDFGTDRGIDGMCLDTEGNILATAGWMRGGPGPMIYVFSPSGEVLEQHIVPADNPTNCTFGDRDLKTLYVTTMEGYLFRVRTDRQGKLTYPKISH